MSRFDVRHPDTTWTVSGDEVRAVSSDGSTARFEVPFGPPPLASLAAVYAHLERPRRLGVLLVRRGGFAVARLSGDEVLASKVGKRHVQGRTKAGGWSQQRFARRRDNQARVAFDAAGDHVQAILLPFARGLEALIVGGDRAAVESVLARAALSPMMDLPQRWVGGVGDPTRAVLDRAIDAGRSVAIEVTDTADPGR